MELLRSRQKPSSKKGDRLFLWSVVLLLLTGACLASWIGSFYVVLHPENPKCYRILKKFKRVEPPKRFRVIEAPQGDFLTASKLLERYGKLGRLELENQNAELLRAFLMNFRETKRRVPYIAGRFRVVQSYELRKGDFIPSGAVAIAQSETLPQVLIEYIFPAAPGEGAKIRKVLASGAEIALERSRDIWALVHVEHYAGGMQFTAVPLPYGAWQLKQSGAKFALKSPAELSVDHGIELNIGAGLPVVRDPRLSRDLAEFRQSRRKAMAAAGDDQAALSGPELVRFEVPETALLASSTKEKAGAQPVALAPARPPIIGSTTKPLPTPAPSVPLPLRPVVRTLPPRDLIGAAPESPRAAAQPTVPPPPAEPAAVAHRVLSVSEASNLVGKYGAEEAALLSGDFVVTGVLGRRVAMRTREALRDPDADPTKPGNNAALIVVDFPEGAVPAKDSSLTRDSAKGFHIRDVIRGANGQITIIAAEHIR
jgi:hypothetical protein